MKRKTTLAAIAGAVLTAGVAFTAGASAASATVGNGPQTLSSFGYEVVSSPSLVSLPPGNIGNNGAACPTGKRAVGGGAVVTDNLNRGSDAFDVIISNSHPVGVGWNVTGKNTSSSQTELLGAVAVCASV